MRPCRASAFVINAPTYSDGDPTLKPTRVSYTLTPTNSDAFHTYLQKIATKWMDEEAGGAEKAHKAVTYVFLDRIYTLPGLPSGYVLWERPRPSGKHVDRYLYGHPSRKGFDSPIRFYPHWKYLLNFGSGQSGPVDEEGTPDVYRSLFSLLKSEGRLDRKIEEKASLDWRSEKPLVDLLASTIPNQPSFLPRQGEMVFYLRPLVPHLDLRYDPVTQQFRIWDNISNTYSSTPPEWLAGIITQVPSTPPTRDFLNPSTALTTADNGSSLTTAGYRIYPLLSPSWAQKHLAKQHIYTSLPLIRPFFLHPNTLHAIPPSAYHQSVTNALAHSAIVSLIDKHTFTGAWPNATIHSRGIFISSEAYWIGDTAVLLPEQADPSSTTTTAPTEPPKITEIMHITAIVTEFHNLQPGGPSDNSSNNGDNDITGNICSTITISLHGPVYTSNPTHSLSRLPVSPAAYTAPMQSYGIPWYHISAADDIWAAPFSRVMSRLYEKAAMEAWVGGAPTHDTDDVMVPGGTQEGIITARALAARDDDRIASAGKRWFWGDHRAEALALAAVAGVHMGRHDEERRPGLWRDVLRVLDGRAGTVAGSTSSAGLRDRDGVAGGEKKRKGAGAAGSVVAREESDDEGVKKKRIKVEVVVAGD
ncbi:MAG: hypothetical protein LQ344_001777 [Seirophora lacunosa]|nr:MAG: hypothetical protein LQ344_001777 [Seirophora lacunosa]